MKTKIIALVIMLSFIPVPAQAISYCKSSQANQIQTRKSFGKKYIVQCKQSGASKKYHWVTV